MKIIWHKLGNSVNSSIRHTHRPAYIPDCSFGGKCTESNDLCHMVCTVFLRYIINNFAPSDIAKIYIKIRH